MLMAYLLTTHRVCNTMSAYQLLRNALNFLGMRIIYMSLYKAMKVDICTCFHAALSFPML